MFFNKAEKVRKNAEKQLLKAIQAMSGVEGAADPVQIESLLTYMRLNNSIGGTLNNYKNYESQVAETYRKYNGEADWGNQQTRAVVDIRSAFISGEGFSISCEDERCADWITDFLDKNKFFGTRLFNAVVSGEITGKVLLNLKPVLAEMPRIIKIPFHNDNKYEVVLRDSWDPESIEDVVKEENGKKVSLGLKNFVFLKLSGDDRSVNKTTTRVGVVLNDLENYDRALKDIRRINHICARITPTWDTSVGGTSAKTIKEDLQKDKWKIGDAYIGSAKFSYETPGTGAHENLKSELSSTIKTISSVTGIPVHWIGWTDLMSNRATAESLYESINNATVFERTIWAEGMYELLVKAQEVYINSGGSEISHVNTDFEVRIPVIDFSNFLNIVKALSTAFNDGVISKADYQNFIPGINPLYTNRQLEEEEEKNAEKFISTSLFGGEQDDRTGKENRGA